MGRGFAPLNPQGWTWLEAVWRLSERRYSVVPYSDVRVYGFDEYGQPSSEVVSLPEAWRMRDTDAVDEEC